MYKHLRGIITIAVVIVARLALGKMLDAMEQASPALPGVAASGSINTSFIVALLITIVVTIICMVIKARILPRFKQKPEGVQSMIEAPVALLSKVHAPETAKKHKEEKPKKQVDPEKKKRKRIIMASVFALWLICGLLLGLIPHESEGLHVEIFAPTWNVFGMEVNSSVFMAVVATVIITIICLLLRLFVIPKFKEKPTGIQTLLEAAIEELSKYTRAKGHGTGDNLSAYMLAVALLLVVSALLELFAFRPPTADLVMTFSLALCTFLLVNYYGLRKKGLAGRLKGFAQPMKIMVPFKIISEIANPISLACRLFGNMLGGMIVIELVYIALGNFGVGIPGVLGLYFNMFHPLIQTFIFITLSLTFISEATEDTDA